MANSIMRIASIQVQKIVNATIKPFNVESPTIKVQTVTNLPDVDYNTPTLLQVFNMNKDKKTKLAFGVADIKSFCAKVVESFDKNDEECVIESLSTTDQGFLNIKIKEKVIQEVMNNYLRDGLNFPL